jgi:hypothetical protein
VPGCALCCASFDGLTVEPGAFGGSTVGAGCGCCDCVGVCEVPGGVVRGDEAGGAGVGCDDCARAAMADKAIKKESAAQTADDRTMMTDGPSLEIISHPNADDGRQFRRAIRGVP